MYDRRVKGLYYQNDHLASISSSGDVTIWTINIENQEVTELCTTNIGCRPICLTMLNLADFADEYVLKRETEEENTVIASGNNGKSVSKASKSIGKVIIETGDDEEEVDTAKNVLKPTKNKVFMGLMYL